MAGVSKIMTAEHEDEIYPAGMLVTLITARHATNTGCTINEVARLPQYDKYLRNLEPPVCIIAPTFSPCSLFVKFRTNRSPTSFVLWYL